MKAVLLFVLAALSVSSAADLRFARAHANARQFERDVQACRLLLHAWLKHADPRTLLLPDNPGAPRGEWIYTPHNSGADLYPYLVLTAELTDPDLYRGRMLEMLRNEVRFTTAKGAIPANLKLEAGTLGEPSLFGAGEYAKDGLISVTEYLGRTPYFHRMVDMVAGAMKEDKIPGGNPELDGDYLQALVRLATMTGDARFLEWNRRIADYYTGEVLPKNFGEPAARLRLRDHGNETVVGLTLQYALEHDLGSARAPKYEAAVRTMLDRILASANPDGMLYNEVNAETLAPVNKNLSDNWGYVYGAVYTFYQCTGESKYRDAVRRVLSNLPKYRRWEWEPSKRERIKGLGSFDGYADSIESAIYLVNREPVAEALEWIDSEIELMLSMQRPDGHVEDWYGEGNFNRTALLHAYMNSQGVRPDTWKPGTSVGAVKEGDALYLAIEARSPVALRFDYARHKRTMNLAKNYVRLNEFPEWFAVDENTLYSLRNSGAPERERVYLGSELIAGVTLEPGDWEVRPAGQPPYGILNQR